MNERHDVSYPRRKLVFFSILDPSIKKAVREVLKTKEEQAFVVGGYLNLITAVP
jgi:hypothetical protein